MRVNTNSVSTRANVRAQQAWLHAIRAETPVLVPEPLAALSGEFVVQVPCAELGGEALVTVAHWLEGEDIRVCLPAQAQALGAAMARLHAQAAHWSPPAGTELPDYVAPLFGDPDQLTPALARLPRRDADVVRIALQRSAIAFDEVCRNTSRIALHADLHGDNLKWHRGQLAIFDFDDAGMSVPILDLAVAVFYLRGGGPDEEAALLDGYASVRALPEHDGSRFEAIVAARQLLLANALLQTSTAAWREEADSYLATTVSRLRNWLETGRFTLAS